DAATLARCGAVAIGHRPYTVVADSAHLYVSDWGDSTVSVIDLSASPPARRTTLFVGPHPSALALRGADLYVALAGANAVARVDLRTASVVEQLAVALSPRAPTGSDPNALALSPDGRTLYVAMAGNNAVAVVRIGRTGMRVAGLIPAGWYPTAVATAADGRTLFVANGKGNGSGANRDETYIGNVITGSVSIVPVPDDATLARYTRDVYALSPYSNARIRPTVRASDRPTQVKHVVYIIRENRTYDQVLGDVRGANGDPELAIFNDSITPNAHAIARRWVVFDNFYVDGEVSADGHEWSDRAFAGDYNEKTWPQIYGHGRNWDLEDGDDLVNPHGAYLWDAARRKGLWVVNFGERSETDSGPGGSTHTKLSGPGVGFGPLAEVHHPQPLAPGRVPQIGAVRVDQIVAVLQVPVASVPVDLGPGLFVIIAGERAVGPLVPVRRDFAVHVKVVEQHPAACDRVGVGRDGIVEDGELRIAVAAARVSQHLIIGAVFANDVDDVAHGRTRRRAVRGDVAQSRVRVGAQRGHLTRVAGQRRVVGHGHDRDRAGDHVADVRPVAIGAGAVPLAVDDEQGAAVGRRRDGGRVPARGDESGDPHARAPDPDHGDRVVPGHGDVQGAAV